MLLLYAGALIPLYHFALKKVWSGILEPKLASEKVKTPKFRAPLGKKSLPSYSKI